MTTIELTEEQCLALHTGQGKAVDVVDPATQRHYVLLARDQYERVRPFLEEAAQQEAPESAASVPLGILRSQQTFWRDLPELLADRKNHGKSACYHGAERIGIAASDEPLLRECLRRGISDDAFHIGVIEPRTRPPWEPEACEAGGHEVADVLTDGARDSSDKSS